MTLFSEMGKIREKHIGTFGYVNLTCLLDIHEVM